MSPEAERTTQISAVNSDATLVRLGQDPDWFAAVRKHNGTLSYRVPTPHTNWERRWQVPFFSVLKHDRSRWRFTVTCRPYWQIWTVSDIYVRALRPNRLILTEQGPPWERDCTSHIQDVLRLSSISKVHYRVHKGQPLDPILSHLNPTHIITHYSRTTLICIIFPSTHLKWSHSFHDLQLTFCRF
jgi:hypothetical protein